MLKQTEEHPPCYGKEFDGKEAACVGGYDPTYQDDSSHRRPVCDYMQTCRIRTQAAKQAETIVPITNLTRPTIASPTVPAYYRPTPPTQPSHRPSAPVGWMGSEIPQYLTVREVHDSGSIMKRLGWEMIRSIGKSLGHTIAHFFDTEAFGGRQDNRGNPR